MYCAIICRLVTTMRRWSVVVMVAVVVEVLLTATFKPLMSKQYII